MRTHMQLSEQQRVMAQAEWTKRRVKAYKHSYVDGTWEEATYNTVVLVSGGLDEGSASAHTHTQHMRAQSLTLHEDEELS